MLAPRVQEIGGEGEQAPLPLGDLDQGHRLEEGNGWQPVDFSVDAKDRLHAVTGAGMPSGYLTQDISHCTDKLGRALVGPSSFTVCSLTLLKRGCHRTGLPNAHAQRPKRA